jgi:hypothetical protein
MDAVRRLRLRLRRIGNGEPATEHPPLPAAGQKRWKFYYDKMRRNFEDKGAPPHG